jgi:hypothetical protein
MNGEPLTAMNWPEHVTTDTLAVMAVAQRPMTARQVAEAILAADVAHRDFYGQFRLNPQGWPDIRLIRRIKNILRIHSTLPAGQARLRVMGRVADGTIYANA